MDNTKLFIIPLLLVLALSTGFATTSIGGIVSHGDGTLLPMSVNCSNSSVSNTTVAGSDGTFNITLMDSAVFADGEYTCIATGVVGYVAYTGTETVTVSGDTEQNITCTSSFDNDYAGTDVAPIGIDLLGTILVALVSFGLLIGAIITFNYAKGSKKPFGKI